MVRKYTIKEKEELKRKIDDARFWWGFIYMSLFILFIFVLILIYLYATKVL